MEKNKIKIYIEVPRKLIDLDDPGIGFTSYFRDDFERNVFNKAVERAVEGLDIPKIEIKPSEIKDKMLQILAERALERE